MHLWSPLNDRQPALLTRIGDDPVASGSPELADTAHTLKGRGLAQAGWEAASIWSTAITRTGRSRLSAGTG
ncbi:hypothetical protein SAV31267_046490 [Streptomyces avermitilis]|nr:hypothetical protein SAV31267_046490 [Streptomyces avermitilis]